MKIQEELYSKEPSLIFNKTSAYRSSRDHTRTQTGEITLSSKKREDWQRENTALSYGANIRNGIIRRKVSRVDTANNAIVRAQKSAMKNFLWESAFAFVQRGRYVTRDFFRLDFGAYRRVNWQDHPILQGDHRESRCVNKNDDISDFERAEGVKMLKWIKVRQNASTTTTATSATTPPSPGQEIRNDEARVRAGDKIEEEGEDSGMEKEDSVCNVEPGDLKKVRFYRSLHRV